MINPNGNLNFVLPLSIIVFPLTILIYVENNLFVNTA